MNKAILTGDIVNFTRLNPRGREALVKDAQQLLEALVPQKGHAEFFRGDSFQLLLPNVEDALYKSIQIRCWFKKAGGSKEKSLLDAKMSIGIGGISYFGHSVLDSDGEAFHLSGRTFDKMTEERLRITVADEKMNKQLEVIADLMNVIITDWTKGQSEVIYMTLQRKTQQQIATELGITQSAVNNRLRLSKWNEIEKTIKYISSLINGSF